MDGRVTAIFTATTTLVLSFVLFAQNPVQLPYSGNYSGNAQGTLTITGLPSGCSVASVTVSGSVITATLSCGIVPPPVGCAVSVTPSGGTDNANLNAAIIRAAGKCVELTSGTYKLSPWSPPSGTNLSLDDGVTVNDVPGYGNFDPMVNLSNGNITIQAVGPNKSAGFTMPNSYASNINNPNEDTNQYKHCFLFTGGSANIVLRGFWVTKCGGDGFTISGGNHLVIDSVDSSANIRQGLAVTGASDTVAISNAKFHDGRATGMDFEPNLPGDSLTNYTLSNLNTFNNAGGGISWGLFNLSSAARVSISGSSLISTNDNQYGFLFFNNSTSNNEASGSITCTNCKAINPQYAGTYGRHSTAGWQMTWTNLIVTGANRGGRDPHYGMDASIGVGIYSPNGGTPGGVTWSNVQIQGGDNCYDVNGAQNTTISGTCNGKNISYP